MQASSAPMDDISGSGRTPDEAFGGDSDEAVKALDYAEPEGALVGRHPVTSGGLADGRLQVLDRGAPLLPDEIDGLDGIRRVQAVAFGRVTRRLIKAGFRDKKRAGRLARSPPCAKSIRQEVFPC